MPSNVAVEKPTDGMELAAGTDGTTATSRTTDGTRKRRWETRFLRVRISLQSKHPRPNLPGVYDTRTHRSMTIEGISSRSEGGSSQPDALTSPGPGTVASMVVVYGGPGGFFREGDHRVGLSSS